MKSARLAIILFILCSTIFGCAGTLTSKFKHDDSFRINEPQKQESCYDAAVLLGVDMKRGMDIAKKVIVGLDATISKETENSIEAQKNRHIGVFIGSGGEELVIQLNKIDDAKTFVTATTKTGFVGALGQKAWSCEIIDQMVKMVSK